MENVSLVVPFYDSRCMRARYHNIVVDNFSMSDIREKKLNGVCAWKVRCSLLHRLSKFFM